MPTNPNLFPLAGTMPVTGEAQQVGQAQPIPSRQIPGPRPYPWMGYQGYMGPMPQIPQMPNFGGGMSSQGGGFDPQLGPGVATPGMGPTGPPPDQSGHWQWQNTPPPGHWVYQAIAGTGGPGGAAHNASKPGETMR